MYIYFYFSYMELRYMYIYSVNDTERLRFRMISVNGTVFGWRYGAGTEWIRLTVPNSVNGTERLRYGTVAQRNGYATGCTTERLRCVKVQLFLKGWDNASERPYGEVAHSRNTHSHLQI